jgi:hypothetical protein
MQILNLTNVGVRMANTPFAKGYSVEIQNPTAGAISIEGSDDGVTYTLPVAVPANSAINATLRAFHRTTTAATLILRGDLS